MKKIIAIFITFLSCVSYALPRPSLYEVTIPVASQDNEARLQAARSGLIEILTKLTADPDIDKKAVLQSNLDKADFYIDEFSYLPAEEGYKLQIKFAGKSIRELLKRNQIAFWADSKPTVLVWLAYKEKDQNTEFIGNENKTALLTTFNDQSKQFGISLMFPMMDISDLDQMEAESIMKMPPAVFIKASKRYSANAILIGEIRATSSNYQSEWKLIAADKIWVWSIKQDSLQALSKQIISQTGKALVNQYVPLSEDVPMQSLAIEVTNITQKDDLAKLLKYVKKLSLVQDVELLELKGNVVQLSLQLKGEGSAFQENAAIGQKLVFKSQDLANNKLIYEWVH